MYLLHMKDRDGYRVFWEEGFGWADLQSATMYPEPEPVIEGEWLFIGKRGELLEQAAFMLDVIEILEQHDDTNLASSAGRLALAGWLAEGLHSRPASEADLISDEIYDRGYVIYYA